MGDTYIQIEDANYNKLNASSVVMERNTYEFLLVIIIIFGTIITMQMMVFFYYTRKIVNEFCRKINPITRINRKQPLLIQMGEFNHKLEISPSEEIEVEQSNK